MLARLIHDLTKGRLRLPLRTGASSTKGDLRLDGRVPRLASDETTPRDMRLLTDLDLNTPGNPPALRADGTLDPAVIPSTSGGGSSGGGDLVGEIKAWAGHPLRVPSGWLTCDGAETLIAAYPNLFAALGYQWGRPSNPSLYFKVPNLVGRVLMGGLGPNDSSEGKIHKVNIRNPGSSYTPGTYTGLTLIADAPAAFSTPATVTVVVGAGGTVESVRVVTGGAVSGVQVSANPTTGPSNCSITIPAFGGGTGFTYDVYLAPTSTDMQAWGVKMTNRGVGYTSQPEVTISGVGLVGATAVAVRDGDNIREVIITNHGTGDPTAATVTFSGGGASTPATASIGFWSSPTVPGDQGGEQQHMQVAGEVGPHSHGVPSSWYPYNIYAMTGYLATAGGAQAVAPTPSAANTSGQPPNQRPPYAGVTFVIRAS